jgi:putative heme iron utilization protein
MRDKMDSAPRKTTDPIQEPDAEARGLARALLDGARFGALAVHDPETAYPSVSRVAVGTEKTGAPIALVSELSHHTRALRGDPRCSLLLGEPGQTGDPLTYPRITLQCRAGFLGRDDASYADLRTRWLASHPKSKLYIDFADFFFARFAVEAGHLVGGFGRAYRIAPKDLGL